MASKTLRRLILDVKCYAFFAPNGHLYCSAFHTSFLRLPLRNSLYPKVTKDIRTNRFNATLYIAQVPIISSAILFSFKSVLHFWCKNIHDILTSLMVILSRRVNSIFHFHKTLSSRDFYSEQTVGTWCNYRTPQEENNRSVYWYREIYAYNYSYIGVNIVWFVFEASHKYVYRHMKITCCICYV